MPPGARRRPGRVPAANRVALDPRTQVSLGQNTAALVGTIVPNTGVLLNGIFQAGQGIPKTNYTWPAIALAPRVGFAYDVTGPQQFVVRGAGGVFFDRPSGQYTFAQAGNPPTGQVSTVQYSTLQSIPPEGLQTIAPPLLVGLPLRCENSDERDVERRRADGVAVLVVAGRVVRGDARLQPAGLRSLRTDDRRECPGPQCARPGRSVSAAEPGSDARDEHDSRSHRP